MTMLDKFEREAAKDIANYLTEVAHYLEVFTGKPRHDTCNGLCGHRLCENSGCLKYRIRNARALSKASP